MVFQKGILLCIDRRRFTLTIYMCAAIRFDYVFNDSPTTWSLSSWFLFSHCAAGNTDITGIWNDCWCSVWSQSTFECFDLFLPRFSTPLNERVINFKLIFAAGCCSGAVRYCAFRRILWIFLTFGGRTKMASLAIPCIIFEICHRGCDTCHFWL